MVVLQTVLVVIPGLYRPYSPQQVSLASVAAVCSRSCGTRDLCPRRPPCREATAQTGEPVAQLTCITAGLVMIDFEREEAGSGLAGQTGAEGWSSGCSFGQLPCPQPWRGGGRRGEHLAGGGARAGELDIASFSPDHGYVADLSGAWNWVKCHGYPQLTPWERCPGLQAAHKSCLEWQQAGTGDRLAAGRAAAPPGCVPHTASADTRGPKALEEPRASNATEQPQSQYCPATTFCLSQPSLIPCPFQN